MNWCLSSLFASSSAGGNWHGSGTERIVRLRNHNSGVRKLQLKSIYYKHPTVRTWKGLNSPFSHLLELFQGPRTELTLKSYPGNLTSKTHPCILVFFIFMAFCWKVTKFKTHIQKGSTVECWIVNASCYFFFW